MACADDADYMSMVQVCRSLVVEYDWCVVAFFQSYGIALIVHDEWENSLLLVILQFLFGVSEFFISMQENACQVFGGVWYQRLDIVSMLHDGRCRSSLPI